MSHHTNPVIKKHIESSETLLQQMNALAAQLWSFRRLMITAVAFMLIGNMASAELYNFNVEATFDETADNEPPFAAPGGTNRYSFQLDTDAFIDRGNSIEFPDVELDYELNGLETSYTLSVLLGNPIEGGNGIVAAVSLSPGRQLNLNLPEFDLYELVDGQVDILPGETEFTGGFLGINRFRGTLSITLAEPMVLHVPEDFPTIQSAVDAAYPGDKIVVRRGCYNELVHIETPDIEINGNYAVLEGTFSCVADNVKIKNWIIDATFNDQAVWFSGVDGCSAKRLLIIGGTRGMWLRDATNCQVRNCWIFDTLFDAIGCTGDLSGTLVKGNVLIGQDVGMYFAAPSWGATVRNNYLFCSSGEFATGDLDGHTFRRNYPR